jgi:hypothetical protein
MNARYPAISICIMIITIALALGISKVYAQDINIGSGIVLSLGGSTLDLNCSNLTIENGGRLRAGNGRIEEAEHLTIDTGGTLDGENGRIVDLGIWTNNGTVNLGNLSIHFSGACVVANDANGTGDTDGDGRPDGEEGLYDADGDGISAFLDLHDLAPTVFAINAWGTLLFLILIGFMGVYYLRRQGSVA